MRAAIVNQETGVVENVILLPDPQKSKSGEYTPPKGRIVIETDWASPGHIWDGNDFYDPTGKQTRDKPFDPKAQH